MHPPTLKDGRTSSSSPSSGISSKASTEESTKGSSSARETVEKYSLMMRDCYERIDDCDDNDDDDDDDVEPTRTTVVTSIVSQSKHYSSYELNRKPRSGKSPSKSRGESNSGSFYLHDPGRVSYNRLTNLFTNSECGDDEEASILSSQSASKSSKSSHGGKYTRSLTPNPKPKNNPESSFSFSEPEYEVILDSAIDALSSREKKRQQGCPLFLLDSSFPL